MTRIEQIKKDYLSLKARVSYMITLAFLYLSQTIVYANGGKLGSSKLGTGTKQLIEDATSWMIIIAPLVGTLVVIYFFVRKGMSEEMDHRKWQDRINIAIISTVGAFLASVIINLAISYYK